MFPKKMLTRQTWRRYTQERFNARFEEQDGSGDTYYDKFYDDEQSSSNEYDELDGFI